MPAADANPAMAARARLALCAVLRPMALAARDVWVKLLRTCPSGPVAPSRTLIVIPMPSWFSATTYLFVLFALAWARLIALAMSLRCFFARSTCHSMSSKVMPRIHGLVKL